MNEMNNELIRKYTNEYRTFLYAPGMEYLRVYKSGRLSGFIWNINRIITIDGDEVNSKDFFN